MDLLVVLTSADRQNGHAVGFCKTGFGGAQKGVTATTSAPLALPDALYWPRFCRSSTRHAACGHFHLGHHCRAVLTVETWGAAGEQLLRAKCRQGYELVGVQVRWASYHHVPYLQKRETCDSE